MAPYTRRKLVLDAAHAILLIMATGLVVALVLTISYASNEGDERKPASIAAALADISPAMMRSEGSG